MRTTLAALFVALTAWTSPAAANDLVTGATCLLQQVACNKSCPRGQAGLACINACGTKAQACLASGKPKGDGEEGDGDGDDKNATPKLKARVGVAGR